MTKFSLFLLFTTSVFFMFACSREGLASVNMTGLIKERLPNGLTAIVKETQRAPVVAVQVWVKAGSSYETNEEAGITHLIEHMIFKGTEKRGPGELARIIESLGGKINAYTSYDYTVYHCVVPKDHLKTALDVLSDAIFHSTFDPNELEREKKVVLEEMKMRLDTPRTMLYEDLMKISYKLYPYNRPIIGFEETVTSFTREDILSYMKKHYRPCNMAVLVVGDVEKGRALKEIEEFFSSGKGSSCKEPAFPDEPEQFEPRITSRGMDCNEGYIAVSVSGIPNFNSEDVPALDLLGALLSDGESSLWVSKLKNKLQLVHNISAYAFTPKGPGLFEISSETDPDKLKKALEGILSELFKLKSMDFSKKEIEKAKTQVITDFIYSQETMEGEARKLGVFQVLSGDPLNEEKYIKKIQKLTPEDIKRICKKYINPKRINVSVVYPETINFNINKDELLTMIENVQKEAKNKAEGIISIGETPIKKFSLTNGVTVLCQESHDLPVVAIRAIFPGGLRYERSENNGIFNLFAKAWTKGTTFHNASSISEIIDGMGADLNGFSGKNTFGLSGRFTSFNFNKGLKLFFEILLSPTFPQDEIEKLKPHILAQIRKQDDYMPGVAIREFKKLLFSPHPYGMDVLGTPENVMAFSSEDLKRLYKEYVVPDRAIISVVGDIDAEELREQLNSILNSWQNESDSFLPTPPEPRVLSSPKVVNIHREKQQEHIVLGFMGTGLLKEDRYALEVLNAILSGQGGRLFSTLRDKESLAYAVTSFTDFGIDYGFFATYIACSPEKKLSAQKGLWRELYKIQNEPPTTEEIERAKNWLIGRYQISLQTPGAKAMDMGLNELYGLGANFYLKYPELIKKVSSQDVQQVAKKYLDSQRYVLVVVGP